MDEKIRTLGRLIAEARHAVVFTGAGVSVESGIPDFRSPGGIWERCDPDEFEYSAFCTDPARYWRNRLAGRHAAALDIFRAEPNPAHIAIARLEEMGRVRMVITQNIDNLHQDAGSRNVVELHGNARWARCQRCRARIPVAEADRRARSGEIPPLCSCGGILKPDVVFFGEMLPQQAIDRAFAGAMACDLMVVVGSSLVVHPAASIPAMAAEHARLCIVNLSPTPLDDLADVVIHGKAGEVLPEVVAVVEGICRVGGGGSSSRGES
ncbi:MAG: NAD-dependent protein deacylase [Methanoculleaceae archaeon]